MIRQLIESDRATTLAFLKKEAAINLFLIGDIEQDGFHQDFQTLWGDFDAQGQLKGVLLRYQTFYIPYYATSDFDPLPFVQIMEADTKYTGISGKESVLAKFRPFFPHYKYKDTFFCELQKTDLLPAVTTFPVGIATAKDASRICTLLGQIEEFSDATTSVENLTRVLESGAGRAYYTETVDGSLQNIVQTSAENSVSAMIVGVATLPAYRGMGLMTNCLAKLCRDLIEKENKSLCLFYDNPEAGRIYHKLGFQSIDKWTMLLVTRS